MTWTHIATEALLFQTGYLTIRRTELRGGRMYYRLGYPNQEVQQSLNESLLNHLTGNPSRQAKHSARLYDLLLVNDFDSLETLFASFFASIPYEWHTNNEIANYEGYYASVFYSYFASLGLAITVEDSSREGRLDMAVEFNGNVYLFEFKVVERVSAGAADQAVEGERLRSQVSRSWRADLPNWGGVQPRDPHLGGFRSRAYVNVAGQYLGS